MKMARPVLNQTKFSYITYGLICLPMFIYLSFLFRPYINLNPFVNKHEDHFMEKWKENSKTDHIPIIYDPFSCKASYCTEDYPIPHDEKLIGIYGKSLKFQYNFPIKRTYSVQSLFNQGLLLLYAYNTVEAKRNFVAATEIDQLCAICYWGLAYSYSANINSYSTEDSVYSGRKAMEKAIDLIYLYKNNYTEWEHDLIISMNERFPTSISEWNDFGQQHYNLKYMNAMAILYTKYSNNPDIKAFYADAIINTSPWEYFESNRKTPLPRIDIAIKALRECLELSAYKHPLALHLYIHITEQYIDPYLGKQAADALASITGNDGTSHLSHMPSHTYFRIGSYDECIRSSLRSVEVDNYYASKCLTTYFPLHNRALLVSCAMSSGDYHLAIDYSFDLQHTNNFIADYGLQLFPTPIEFIHSRFGRWEDILNKNENEKNMEEYFGDNSQNNLSRELDRNSLSYRPIFIQTIYQYAYTLAFIHIYFQSSIVSHEISSEVQRNMILLSHLVENIPTDIIPSDHIFYPYHKELGYLMNMTVTAAYYKSKGDILSAIQIMNEAVRLQSTFKYMEPEQFYLPTKQCLAALHLYRSRDRHRFVSYGNSSSIQSGNQYEYNQDKEDQDKNRLYHAKEARLYYISDLRDHPKNGWSIKGLEITLRTIASMQSTDTVSSKPWLRRRDRRHLLSDITWNITIDWENISVDDLDHMFQNVWSRKERDIIGSCCEMNLC